MRAGSGESPSFIDTSARRALERVELVSAAGVALAGAGLALLFADRLAPFTVLILSSGLVIHAIAMFGKRRIEHRANLPRERWIDVLYWVCWLALGGLGLLVFTR
ncbi:MAG: hypothetical protein LT102_09305 [Burkholderiaceae bacterium]|jgi:membrane-bound ClpP family serine protease|nr:hypothetical protein [Burkholderiaceae bacterium]